MTIALIETTRERPRPDAELARAAGSGDAAAFEALYERHHRALLSFARHMLGRVHDAEDVVQHTFLSADAAFRRGVVPASVRAWLYTVARNRCISILRARRDDQALPELDMPSSENLAEEIEQRDDLRALLADLRMLPDDQRTALLLAELGELSHSEVAQVLGVRPRKVKALVYQARQALLAAAGARAIPCRSIREELAVATGSARRRRHLQDHVARCDGCRAYAAGVSRQRASLAMLLPVVPTVALRDTVLGCLGAGGTAAAATAGAGAGAGIGLVGAKLLAIAAIGGAAAGGATVAVTAPDEPRAERRAAAASRPAPPMPPAGARSAPAPAAAPRIAAGDEPGRNARRDAARQKPPRPAARSERRRSKPAKPPGLAGAGGRQRAHGESRPRIKPEKAAKRVAGKPAKPVSGKPAAGKPATPPAGKPDKAAPEQFGAAPAKPVSRAPRAPAQRAQPAASASAPAGTNAVAAAPATVVPAQAKRPDEPRGRREQK